jgi:hypothetical protein
VRELEREAESEGGVWIAEADVIWGRGKARLHLQGEARESVYIVADTVVARSDNRGERP